MVTLEQAKAQLAAIPDWAHFAAHFNNHVEQAQRFADAGELDLLLSFPTSVLLFTSGPTADKAVSYRINLFRGQIEEGRRDFALGNQPPFVIEAVEDWEL